MPAPRGDRQTVADPHRELAATLNKQLEAGIAPWQTPWTPGARVPVEPITTPWPAAPRAREGAE